VAIGGGFVTSNVSIPGAVAITNSSATDADTWTVTGDNSTTAGDASYSLAAFVICATGP
jgi:hypothetical protein